MAYDKKYLYKLTFPNGMVYIGATKNIKSRWAGNGCQYRGLSVGKAIEEFGWENIKCEILLKLSGSIADNDIILKMERELIYAYGDRCYNKMCTAVYSEEKREREAPLHPCRVFWEIDDVEKPAREWCKEYNVSYSKVWNRMRKYGLTPEQALTLPNVPMEYKRRAMEYWKELGLLKAG